MNFTPQLLTTQASLDLPHQVARHSAEGITYRLALQLLTITIRLLFEPPRLFTDVVSHYLFNVTLF